MTASEPCDLERFVTAQAPVFPTVLAELKGSGSEPTGALTRKMDGLAEDPYQYLLVFVSTQNKRDSTFTRFIH